MSDELVRHFLRIYNEQVPWPDDTQVTSASKEQFDLGMDILLQYRGHPDVLMEGLRIFVSSGSLPYALAGAAEILSMASYLHDQNYVGSGLKVALIWLKRAQNYAPNLPEINVIEADIYVKGHRLKDARVVLDLINRRSEPFFGNCLTEIYYWQRKNNNAKIREWFDMAWRLSRSDTQRVALLSQLAYTAMLRRNNDEAVKLHRQILEYTPEDPWTWHNLSIAYLNMNELDLAQECSEQALSIMQFGAAFNVLTKIKSRKKSAQSKSFFGKLFGN